MKREIEIKILDIDVKRVRRDLRKIGGRLIMKPTLMHELYFESAQKERAYSSLRLRKEGKKTFLTIKVKKEDKNFEIRDEYEIQVSSFEQAKKILEFMGFKIFRNREKIREEYKLKDTKIELDTYPNMNPYMEIEASSKKDVNTLLKSLNIKNSQIIKGTATEIIKSEGLDPNNLTFKKTAL